MKLYASVSSERATKGQGGNEYLRIELSNVNECFGFVEVLPDESVKVDIRGTVQVFTRAELTASDLCPSCDIPLGDCLC